MNTPNPAIRIAVDPTNPGQFFACCGLLELADRLWQGAEGWFEGQQFWLQPVDAEKQPTATPAGLIDQLTRCRVTNTMTDAEVGRLTVLSGMKAKERAKNDDLEAEK